MSAGTAVEAAGFQRFEARLDEQERVFGNIAGDGLNVIVVDRLGTIDQHSTVIEGMVGHSRQFLPTGKRFRDAGLFCAGFLGQAHIHLAVEIDLKVPTLLQALAAGAGTALLVVDHDWLPIRQAQQAVSLAMHRMAEKLADQPEFVADDLGTKRLEYHRPMLGRFTALISLSLWFGVAGGGRWIGFS